MFGKPPDTVPDGLDAAQYLELAHWYMEKRMFSHARQSFTRSCAAEPEGEVAAECRRWLSRVPKGDAPKEIYERLWRIEAEMALHPQECKRKAEKIAAEYPDCEWPHQLLGAAYLQSGEIEKCMQALQEALRLNPDYAPTLATMARAQAVDMDYEAARASLEAAEAVMPGDNNLANLRRCIDFLIALDGEVN